MVSFKKNKIISHPVKKIYNLVADVKNYPDFLPWCTKILIKETDEKISLATIYNTVHSFKKKEYLKEISVNSEKSYFDTNTSKHNHFLDVTTNELIDLKKDDVDTIKINKNFPGKKIKSVEVLIKIENSN